MEKNQTLHSSLFTLYYLKGWREKPQKPFQTLELNLLKIGGWLSAQKILSIEAVFYGKSLTVKDCTEMAALASRSSSVGSIIMSLGHKPCRNIQRLKKIVAHTKESKK